MLVPIGQDLYFADGLAVSFFGFSVIPDHRRLPRAHCGYGPLLDGSVHRRRPDPRARPIERVAEQTPSPGGGVLFTLHLGGPVRPSDPAFPESTAAGRKGIVLRLGVLVGDPRAHATQLAPELPLTSGCARGASNDRPCREAFPPPERLPQKLRPLPAVLIRPRRDPRPLSPDPPSSLPPLEAGSPPLPSDPRISAEKVWQGGGFARGSNAHVRFIAVALFVARTPRKPPIRHRYRR